MFLKPLCTPQKDLKHEEELNPNLVRGVRFKGAAPHITKKKYLVEVNHELSAFVEVILTALQKSKDLFMSNSREITGEKKGFKALKRDYENFPSPDSEEFECTYDGPGKGSSRKGKPAGCAPFLLRLVPPNVPPEVFFSEIMCCALVFEERYAANTLDENVAKQCQTLAELCSKTMKAMENHEHFYASTSVVANGNLDFALGVQREGDEGRGRFKKNPVAIPRVVERGEGTVDAEAGEEGESREEVAKRVPRCAVCHSPTFRPNVMGINSCPKFGGSVKHCTHLDGRKPK
jgi:hypothetical protein